MKRWRSCASLALLVVLAGLSNATEAAECEDQRRLEQATVDEIVEFFAGKERAVVTFVGYSGAGYEDEQAMLEVAGSILEEFDPATTIVNIGATPDGIGAVYELARALGFQTTGIVSTQAREYGADISACVGHVFFVEDDSWGGLVDDGARLSPTSRAMVAVSDVMIGIGGGEVARDELLVARREGRDVRFVPADMNHRTAIDKAARRGLPEPTDFAGAASRAL